jgi:hypothetical protein
MTWAEHFSALALLGGDEWEEGDLHAIPFDLGGWKL